MRHGTVGGAVICFAVASALAFGVARSGFAGSVHAGNATAGKLVVPPPTVSQPLPDGAVVTLQAATKAFGGALPLPSPSSVGSSSIGAVWMATEPIESTTSIEKTIAV